MTNNPTKSRPSKDEFVTGNILDYLDKLTPSKNGKYFCPVCDGNDLWIHKESGATQCHNNGCSWQDIMDKINPLPNQPQQEKGKNKHREAFKEPSKKDLDSKAIKDDVALDIKTDELAYSAGFGNIEEARALAELATWCKAHGHDKFSSSQLLKTKIRELKKARGDDDGEKPRLLKEYEQIKKRFGEGLRFNELFKRVELDGESFECSMAKVNFSVHHRMNLRGAREDVADITLMIAKENSYSPVKEYLTDVFMRYGDNTDVLNNLAKRYLGTLKPIHETCLMKWLISAVARAFEPGCKVDSVIILQGGQGVGKSTFFALLAGREWFDDSFGNSGDKDERLKLHRTWIIEWAELENVFKRKDVNQVKQFISTQTDILRPPYGRETQVLNRPSVFCGTTNQREFLADETGNRRFWVIPVTQAVPFGLLKEERDRIWAAAVSLYRAGVKWDLTPEETILVAEERRAFESSDIWADEISDFIEGREFVAVADILTKRFEIPKSQQDKKTQIRVKGILSKLGWEPVLNPIWVEGEKKRVWQKPKV
jgi:Virulence-associated protein E